jgi:hypothetical protein
MSVWTAPVTAGGGTRPTVTVKPTSKADVGAVALEYSGVSAVADSSVLDRSTFATGKTGAAASVASGPTQPPTGANELAIGFYLDSGFGDKLTGDPSFSTRANVSPSNDIESLAQDTVVGVPATPNPSFGTGASTYWLTSTVVLKPGGEPPPPTIPGAPTEVTATAGNSSATVSWTAPFNGNSAITSYTITPYIGSTAQPPTTITGSPPASLTTITGLTNGTTYTFKVTATNAIGTSQPSTPSNPATPAAVIPPAFVQSWNAHSLSTSALALAPSGNVAAADRVVVEVGVWSGGGATAAGVTDSAGNSYVELLHFQAAE